MMRMGIAPHFIRMSVESRQNSILRHWGEWARKGRKHLLFRVSILPSLTSSYEPDRIKEANGPGPMDLASQGLLKSLPRIVSCRPSAEQQAA